MVYYYLAGAILFEVIATSTLQATAQFTKLLPSAIVVISYVIAFYLVSLTLKTLPLGITYAIWSSFGVVLVTIAGIFLYKQIPDIPSIIGMSLIVSGVVIIHLFSNTASH